MKSETTTTEVLQKTASNSNGRLESLELVRTGPWPKRIGICLMILLVVAGTFVLFVPWRQSVVGSGEIMVFSPMQRPQTIEAQIPGRILQWYVRDGQLVKAGELIADLADLDPRFLDHNQLKSLIDKRESLNVKRESARQRLDSLNNELVNLSSSKEAAVPAADERISQAKDRLFAAQQSVDVAEQNVKTAQWQLDRVNTLYDKGLRSQRDQQLAALENIRAKTELQRAKSAYDVVKRDAEIAGFDLKRISADTSSSINAIKASIAEAKQVMATTAAEIDSLEIDIQNMAERVQQRAVRAPCAGRVVKLDRVGAGETVAAGAVLATIVPGTEDRAAAILIRDYDAPLVSVGNPVRLAISGWPSLQFVGWPSVAVGTFAGRISVIDAVDDGKHFYRIIVVPDYKAIAAKQEQPWPSSRYLRPGAKATGWVLLNSVPVWYELWRQFNGFQPTVNSTESDNPTGQSETQ
jgi:multidrug efflux pump subunit AcrA (membrane-fusion protein)